MARRPLRRDRRPTFAEHDGPTEGSVIRPAVPSDIGTVVELRALMFEAMGSSSEEISDIGWQQDASRWLQLHLSDEDIHVIVAEAHGTVVSCAIGQVIATVPGPGRRGDGGQISNIATFPRHRRLGFTHAVLGSLLEWFEEETDVEVISLNATEAGWDIYESFGFVETAFPQMRKRLDRAEPDGD